MATILFIDIPVIKETLEDIVSLRYKAQDCINILKKVPKPYQQKRKQFSRGILTLSTYLKQNGNHQVQYCSYEEINNQETLDIIHNSDYVGITGSNTAYFNIVKRIAMFVKKEHSDVSVIVGGNHVTAMDKEVLIECQDIDYVIRGEGEIPLLELVNGISSSLINGLTYRKGQQIISNPSQKPLEFDAIPQPDYSLLPGDLNEYNFNVQSIRGCCYRCNFCPNGYFWESSRITPLDNVLDELSFLNSHLANGTMIHFSDNILSLSRERAFALLNGIKERKIKLLFSCDLKANHVDEVLIKKMQEANFVKISLGFEDMNTQVLQVSNKGILSEDNIKAAKIIKKNSNILVEAYWIIGLPSSTHETMKENLQKIKFLLRNNIVDVISSSTVFTPLPGTPIFDNSQNFGVRILTKNWDEYLRSCFWPVYELESLSRKELSEYFLLYEETILEEYCKKLNLDIQGLQELHRKLLNAP